MRHLSVIALSLLLAISAMAQEQHNPLSVTVTVGQQPAATTSSDYSSLFEGGYEKNNFEFLIGYVNKSWRCTYDNNVQQRENFFGEANLYFHGVQFGFGYTPSFDWGLGLRTGIFLEIYAADRPWMHDYCSYFSEIDLYIPVHAFYRIPFTDDCALNLFGGVGFQLAMDGQYYKYVGTGISYWRGIRNYYATARQEYGTNGWPQRVNWQAECGVNLRIKMMVLSFTYSFGLNEHGIINTFDNGATYVTALKSRQDKMQASIAFTF